MKKILFLLVSITAIGFTACNPLDDTYNQLDKDAAAKGEGYSKDLTLALTENDYKLLKGETASGATNAAKYFDFSSNDEAKVLIPIILNKKYPQLGKNSSALVAYDVYNSVAFKSEISHTITSDEYTAGGFKYGNLSSDADIEKAAFSIYGDDVVDGKTLNLTYLYYSGGVSTRTSKVVFWGGTWHLAYVLTSADYTAMGQKFPDFNDKAVAKSYIETYMGIKFPYGNKAGDYKAIIYDYYANKTDTDVLLIFKYGGSMWASVPDIQQFSLQFGHDGTTWVPDNTIKYTFLIADYQEIAKATADDAAKASLAKYNDFDLSLWTTDEINASIAARLKILFPSAKVGQKYAVTYIAYSGGASNVTVKFILNANGSYDVAKE